MKVEQIYTGCLAHAAYYIESDGEAAIFDPLREVEPYIAKAKKNNANIKYIFETHFHADFVSGHVDLANKTGAVIVFGPTAKPGYKAFIAEDGETFKLGACSIKVIHTPGHTMESSCYLLIDEKGKEQALISGDTLFIGDVGRPDLAQHVIAELTQEKLAGHLFDSLRNKIMPLPDELIIYPNHGAGSACGKNMSKETSDTLGHQKQVNYALNPNLTKEQFIKEILSGLVPPPGYFPSNVLLNIKGSESIDVVLKRGLKPLNVNAFELIAEEKQALIIDTRNADSFAKGFIPNSINIGIDGSFATWVGTLIKDIKQEILFVADAGRENEVVTRLSRIGYDNVLGFLEGGFEAWLKAGKQTDDVTCLSADDLYQHRGQELATLLDVRKVSEFESEHLLTAINIPLDFLNDNMASVHHNELYFIYCASGYRSMTFISILKARGYKYLININGGFKALKASGHFEITEYICPTTLL